MSSRTPQSITDTQLSTGGNTQENEVTVTTKYDANTGSSTQSDAFTENSEELRKEFLGIEHPVTESEPDGETGRDSDESTEKYAHLISREQINAISETRDVEPEHNSTRDVVIKGNYHSEVRFLERADLTHPDCPESLQKAWETGVRVGVEHVANKDFYGYDTARYNEVAGVVMVANENGMIETTLNVFNTMKIQTDHLCTCGNPACGRLYSKVEHGAGCHWCGFTESEGRHKTEAELLPQKKRVETTDADDEEGSDDEVTSVESHNTVCEECNEEFNTLTRLRLHSCE